MSAAKTGSYNFWMDQGATSKPISHQLHTYTSPKLLCSLGLIMHLGRTFLRKKKNHRILCKINEKIYAFSVLKCQIMAY